jgi:16S rRNA (adenine1518-N6/adenine1519-N6)-dimethyltransferase
MSDRLSPLSTPSATRAVLEAHGLATKKSLGQNFLVNDAILQKIVDLAELGPDDDVLEVGPGIGTLTIALLKTSGRVVSVERDTDLPAVLAETCAPWVDRFTLLNKDALDLSADDLPFAPNKLVANLPYAVAATVVLDVFERFASVESATVMVQAEVADRMAAQPGTKNYGAYTVKLRMFA